MDKIDLELIRQMSKTFNLHLEEIDEGDGYTVFDMNGVVQLMPPSEDTDGKWAVYKVTTTPGCHTLPNGDPGYPAEIDVDEVSSHDTCLQGLVEAVKLAVEIAAGDMSFDLAMYHELREEQEGEGDEQSVGQDLQSVSE
jgi:hypothetical protein